MNKKRKPSRLKGFDYASENGYFVTICTQNKKCHFGSVTVDEIKLNEFGKITQACWIELGDAFEDVILDEYIIMPNHIHAILIISKDYRKEIKQYKEKLIFKQGLMNQAPTVEWPLMKNKKESLGKVIRHFKAKTTHQLRTSGLKDFAWQRNYHDHIIRGDKDYASIREYIFYNTVRWEMKNNS